MIAEPAVKANRRVVNQRVLIVVQAQELPMIPDPQSPRHGKHWLDYPPPKQSSNYLNQWNFYKIFRMSSYPAQTRCPSNDDFLSTVLDPQFVNFLPRRIEDSAIVIWVYPGYFKENVRYPVWTCRDPIFSDSKDPMIIFSDSRDPIFNSRDPETP